MSTVLLGKGAAAQWQQQEQQGVGLLEGEQNSSSSSSIHADCCTGAPVLCCEEAYVP